MGDFSIARLCDWCCERSPAEIFPEPRLAVAGSGVNGFRIDHFFPWQIHPDGTGEETLNHVGRHELNGYFDLEEFIAAETRGAATASRWSASATG